MNNCKFCQFFSKEKHAQFIWKDDRHRAFMNSPSAVLVIPNQHYTSDELVLEKDILCQLILAAKKVVKLLDETFLAVESTGLVIEGAGQEHVHATLFLFGSALLSSVTPHLLNKITENVTTIQRMVV